MANALVANTGGSDNTAIGFDALGANTTGNGNIGLGDFAGLGVSTANDVVCIGSPGANVNNSCYIGNIGTQPGGTQAVYVNSEGKLGAQVRRSVLNKKSSAWKKPVKRCFHSDQSASATKKKSIPRGHRSLALWPRR